MNSAFIPLDVMSEAVRQAIHDNCEGSQETLSSKTASEKNIDPA